MNIEDENIILNDKCELIHIREFDIDIIIDYYAKNEG